MIGKIPFSGIGNIIMIKYICKKRFFCGALGRFIPVDAIFCRYENVTKLTVLNAPSTYDDRNVNDFEYTDPTKIVWFDDEDLRNRFFTFVSRYPEDDIGGGIDYEMMRFLGEINFPADFPALSLRNIGDTHYIGTNVTDPITGGSFTAGQTIYWNGSIYRSYGSGGGGGGAGFIERFDLIAANITNKYVTISGTITNPNNVQVFINNAPSQEKDVDFAVDTINNRITWNGLAFEDVLEIGDKMTILVL